MLQGAGYSVSVLLRGYKGRHRGGPLPVSDGRRIRSNSGLAGDEALVIARNLPGALVTVGKDRAGAGRWIERVGKRPTCICLTTASSTGGSTAAWTSSWWT